MNARDYDWLSQHNPLTESGRAEQDRLNAAFRENLKRLDDMPKGDAECNTCKQPFDAHTGFTRNCPGFEGIVGKHFHHVPKVAGAKREGLTTEERREIRASLITLGFRRGTPLKWDESTHLDKGDGAYTEEWWGPGNTHVALTWQPKQD